MSWHRRARPLRESPLIVAPHSPTNLTHIDIQTCAWDFRIRDEEVVAILHADLYACSTSWARLPASPKVALQSGNVVYVEGAPGVPALTWLVLGRLFKGGEVCIGDETGTRCRLAGKESAGG